MDQCIGAHRPGEVVGDREGSGKRGTLVFSHRANQRLAPLATLLGAYGTVVIRAEDVLDADHRVAEDGDLLF